MASEIDVEALREQIKQPGCAPSGLPPECYIGTMHAKIADILSLIAYQNLCAEATNVKSAINRLRHGSDHDRIVAAARYLREAIALLVPERSAEYWDLCDNIVKPVSADS